MSAKIHPTALVAKEAQLGADVEVGAFAIIGPDCVVGDGCVIAPRATLERNVILGKGVKVGSGSVLGGDPQDLKYKGEPTTVGKNCFIMTYVHLAHDCHVGDHVIISNGSQFAGHITIEDRCIISGLVAVHQFVKIGGYSFIGGHSRVPKDVPPYLKAVGNPIKLYGLNTVGLQRNGFQADVVHELKRAYRLFFRSELNVTQAKERAEQELQMFPEVKHFLEFVGASGRGVVM